MPVPWRADARHGPPAIRAIAHQPDLRSYPAALTGLSEDFQAESAAIYGRQSTPRQKTVPQQIDICRQRCEGSGHIVRYVLKEAEGALKERPVLNHLMELVQQHRIDLIVVWKLDRLVRSLRDLLNLANWLAKNNVRLMSVTEQFDTSTSFGRFNFRNIASAAELERDLIAERSVLGKYGQAMAGRWPTQRAPLGYALLADRDLALNTLEVPVVQELFSRYAGQEALTEITYDLSERGVVTRLGRTFSPGAAHAILFNPIYRGLWNVMGVERTREDLRIVEEAVWKKVEQRRGRRVQAREQSRRRKAAIDAVFDDYLLSLSAEEAPLDSP